MADAVARQGLTGRALRRFWPVAVVVALVCGAAATWAAQGISPVYSAEGEYIVPIAPPVVAPLPGELPAPPSPLPATAYDAGVAARTYELVLAGDNALLNELAAQSGIDVDDLVGDSDIVHVEGTRVLRVTFTSESEADVQAYFDTLTTIVTTASPTENLPTGNLRPLKLPDEIGEVAGVGGAAPIVGLLAGLLLGLATAVLLERMDSRLTGPADLRAIAGWPVFDLGGRHTSTAAETAVLRVLRGRPGTQQVAVVTAPRTPFRSATEVAEDLAAAEARLRRSGSLPAAGAVRWEPFGRLADDGYAERGAQTSDAVVVVTPRRASMRAVTRALQSVQDLGLSEVVAVVPNRRRRTADPAAEAPDVEPEVAEGQGAPVTPATGVPVAAEQRAAVPTGGSSARLP